MNSSSMKNIISKIKQVYPVSDEALQELQANMEVRYYPKGTYLVQSGMTDRLVYFIEEGVTRSVFHHNGQDTTTWFSQEGDITFGMDSLYYQRPSIESIETLTDCTIYVIYIDKLNALYEKYIDIANWGRILHQDVNKDLSHIFVERLQLSPKERYDRFNQRHPGLINRVKLKYVAAFLGISIYTLSRVRAQK
ncbi:cAMP-binding proteins [Bacteroides reticulotermitis JCM 10512]|uniref:cAMP-binding proteins n=2 Tax=Bacteroides reticulotermitis TaxID=1133319 RepID=W4UX65_9BACE|nr:cAMP-binding proteins [Bacteroides reticulotermitis JCM 10512]